MLPLAALGQSTASTYDPAKPAQLRPKDLRAESAILIEAKSGEVLFEKNANDVRFPASTTKILTLMLALGAVGDVDEMVTVSEQAVANVPPDSSVIGLQAGEELKFSDLLLATMVASGNDGANVIAERVAGSQQAFVQMMNDAARNMGCTNTNFVNAHGYHDQYHFTTAHDMAIIAREGMKMDAFRQIVKEWRFTLPKTNVSKARALTSQAEAFFAETKDTTPYPYATGIKTGRHSEAGYCFVGAAYKDGVELISVVFKTTAGGRWSDTKKLMEYGFSQYVSTSIGELFTLNPKAIEISGYSLDDENLGLLDLQINKLNPEADDTLSGFKGQDENWLKIYTDRTQITYTRPLEAPVEAGEVMGIMTYTPEGGGEPVEYQLIAARAIKRREALAPSLDDIKAYTNADPNPFPRFSAELLALMLLPVIAVAIISQLLYKLLTKKRKPRVRRRTVYHTRYYR